MCSCNGAREIDVLEAMTLIGLGISSECPMGGDHCAHWVEDFVCCKCKLTFMGEPADVATPKVS